MGMTAERAAEIAAADPAFVPGKPHQHRRRASTGTAAPVPASDLVVPRAGTGSLTPGSKTWERSFDKRLREHFRNTFMECVTTEDFKVVVEKTVAMAKAGEPTARYILFAYLMGKPEEKVEVDVKMSLADMMRRAMDEPDGVIEAQTA